MIIYFSGVILTAIICKAFRGDKHNDNEDVALTIGISVFSWFGLLFLIGVMIYIFFQKK